MGIPSALLIGFVKKRRDLLDALSGLWTHTGRFAWWSEDGRELYTHGLPKSGQIEARFAHGVLRVEGGAPSQEPLLAAQARLLCAAIELQSEVSLLTDELMRTTDQLVALYEVSSTARESRDLGDVMRTCVEQAARLTGARQALLVIRDSAHSQESAVQAFSLPENEPLAQGLVNVVLHVVRRIEDMLIANRPEECARALGVTLDGVARLLLAPIAIGGVADAALCVLNKPDDFISGDMKLVAALADAAAGFLERDRSFLRQLEQARVRRELEIAADIQNQLLPRHVPSLPGVQVVAVSQPASEVGGDFFDVQILSNGMLALALGDVTGRGVPAALFMAMARVLLRAGLQSTQSPVEAVTRLNAGLNVDLSNAGMLLTLFAATFDPASGELDSINCGHSPVLLYHQRRAELWEADGPPIGLLPDLLSTARKRRLDHGDALVVMSDGFSEAHDERGRRMGIAPFLAALESSAGGSASEISSALRAVVPESAAPAGPQDDQTLVIVKVE